MLKRITESLYNPVAKKKKTLNANIDSNIQTK